MRVARVFVLSLLIAACGSSNVPKAAPAASSGESSVTKSSQSESRCLAALVPHRPSSGWVEVGALLITLEDRRPTKFELRDREGKTVDSAVAPKQLKEARKWGMTAACRLGGLVVVGDNEPKDGTATFPILKPVASDERRDLATLCDAPGPDDPRSSPGMKPADQLTVAVQVFEERLTTAKWRAWLRDTVDEIDDRPPNARAPVMRTKADELHDLVATAGIAKCWLEDGLRR